MRAIFGVVGLLLVVAIVGMLARKQLAGGAAPRAATASEAPGPAVPPRQQVQRFEQAVQGSMQQPRPLPEGEQ